VKLHDLKSLGPIKHALAAPRREAAERQAEALRQERERTLFQSSVGPVTPLRERGHAELPRVLPLPHPFQRELDEQAALHEALSDEVDVESLLLTDEGLSFRRVHVGSDVPRRLRRGQWAIQAQIDLHGLRRHEAREALAAFLHGVQQRGLRCVRVVHGKGHGSPGREPVLKGKVRGWLVQSSAVQAFVQARASEGGNGALVVLLAPKD
jgi:DNA-nicking Smr family endonuclease